MEGMLFIFTHLFSTSGLHEFIVLKPGNPFAHQDECRWNINRLKLIYVASKEMKWDH